MKNKIKIFIALGITLITTLILTISTFAYTTNQFSYTLTYDYTDNTGYMYFNYNGDFINTNTSSYYIMVNLTPKGTQNNTRSIELYYLYNNDNSQGTIILGSYYVNRYVTNQQTMTIIQKATTTDNIGISINRIKLYIQNYNITDIQNIDLVNYNDITNMQYVNTYTSNLEEQIEELQEQYNTMSDNYETLEENYQTLSNNYEELETNYETLQNATLENGFYNNINSIIFNGDNEAIDKNTAYKYLSLAYMNFDTLLEENNIYESQNRTGRQNLEIEFIEPINISNFTYYLRFNGLPAESGDPNDYYIAFGNTNGQGKIVYLSEIETKIEIPNNFMCNYIDIFWWNSDIYSSWIETMNSSEYDKGYSEGTQYGYTTGYQAGTTNGIKQGIEQGIQQADSRVNTRKAPHM